MGSNRAMLKWLALGCGGCAWLLAGCGGKLLEGEPHASAGAASAGAASAGAPAAGAPSGGADSAPGGASAGDGTSASAGEAGDSSTCLGDGQVFCTASCGSTSVDYVQGECVRGEWQCPAPQFQSDTCPAEACVLQRVDCCDHEYGARSVPACGPDGLFEPCPAGRERNAKLCVADSAQTSDCGSLEGKSCSLQEALCSAGSAHCSCGPADGGLLWSCWWDLN
jgi:hypothetical protein